MDSDISPADEKLKTQSEGASGSIELISHSMDNNGPMFVSSITKDEPIVTRKELWSYYCKLCLPFPVQPPLC